MLPKTIHDLLNLVDGNGLGSAGCCTATQMLRSAAPRMMILAQDDGAVVLTDDFGSGASADIAAIVKCLAGETIGRAVVRDAGGGQNWLGLRLPQEAGGGILACLVEASVDWHDPPGEGLAVDWLCGALAWATARHKEREGELSARIQQLTAGEETLRASYMRGMAETIEAHEQRLRQQEASQEELRRLHACNELILRSAGEGIIGLDAKGNTTFVNPAVEGFVGWTAAEMVGQPLHSLIHHTKLNRQPNPWLESPIFRTLREATTERIAHEIFWRKDGTSFPVEYVCTPMREGGGIIGAVLTFQDITERRTLEGQLVQAQKLESIGQLAAGIAHEINTPTQFVGDNLRFLEDAFGELMPLLAAAGRRGAQLGGDVTSAGPVPQTELEYLMEEIPKAIAQSLEGVGRVANIVRSMKEFSHPGGDEMQPVDLNKALESTLTVCRNEWKYVAEVVTDFDPDLPLVHCLPGQCNQVFLNLIINAAHAIADKQRGNASQKGIITVRTLADGDWIEIQVVDTGTGIAEEHRSKIFDPFFTTKEVGRGTGQGLAIARSVLVDKHGGTLSFETEVGRGTTFIVRLPRRDGGLAGRGAERAQAAAAP